MTREHPSDHRLIGFLAVSVALHLLWLTIPPPTRNLPPKSAPLVAHLAPPVTPVAPVTLAAPVTQKSAVVARQVERGVARTSTPAPDLVRAETAAAESTAPAIDLDAAFATARLQAREAQPRTSLDAPKPLLTVEAAIARATRRDVLVETRGAAGEYVTTNGKTRCVTPLLVPHFLEGKTMLTQCETRRS
jgi:hypothetical protein